MKSIEQYPGQYVYRQMARAKLFIDKNYATPINLDQMAKEAHFSKYHFIRIFKKIFGKTPNQYLKCVRIEKAKELLKSETKTIVVCYAVGYESLGTFKGLFKHKTNLTPAGFRDEHRTKQMEIKRTPAKFLPHCITKL